jgi:HEPN domain-containing protein
LNTGVKFMDEAKRELVRAWLIKAQNDLDTAPQISAVPEGHLDAAIYHCQQAAEKAVKGFLAFRDHRLERSHDIELLVEIAARYEVGFDKWGEAATILTPYATAYRYPGESTVLEPSRAEFDEALKHASEILNYVLSLLASEVRPQQT